MKKKQKYDAVEDPLISDEDIQKLEDEAQVIISEKEFARLLKKSKKGLIKAKKHTASSKKAA